MPTKTLQSILTTVPSSIRLKPASHQEPWDGEKKNPDRPEKDEQ